MRNTTKSPGEKIVKDIKRATRKQYSAEEKIRIVLDVRRQSFWNQKRRELRECSAHRVGLIMLRVDCDASVALRMSSV